MPIKLTKELVVNAIRKGKVTYNLQGTASSMTPLMVKEYLLRKVEAIENGEEEIDLSLAFDRRPNASK